ncbi:single-stranded DNA-binding protein [Paractinoplanes toevensis]|uniref:Uncharacterized protein n=1 Tax=Paractinoplanes toevensis TaxID=571911 RepID=A0A919WDC0_9ACTN|nr:single-stranded DNA-binding protein [Actinoplanes toevensis]GIM98058.1 hypothetical protein Ato02nite_098510 [Actinoplanes toevensis]
MQFDCLIEGTVTADAESRTTDRDGRPFVTFRLDHQQGYYDRHGTWRNTLCVPYEITCWDRRVMPSLLNIRKGQRVVVHATRFKIRSDRRTGETLFDLTPDVVHTVAGSEQPHIFQLLLAAQVTGSAQSRTVGADQRPMATVRIEHQQGYYNNFGTWKTTLRTPYHLTSFDETLMPALRDLRRGQRVLVHATRFNILPDDGSGEDLLNLTPDIVRVLTEPGPAPQRQRNGHTVVTPHGERIDADKWPDVVTDLEFVHHS